jgi:hypothetical protein
LHASALRLDAVSPYIGFDVGEPEGAGWLAWDSLVPSGVIPRWLDELAAGDALGPLPRQVAGSFLGGRLSGAVVRTVAGMVLLEFRAADVSPGNLLVRRHPDGWFDRLAVRRATMAVLPGDPAAGGGDAVVVAHRRELRRWAAERLVASLAPVLAEVRAASSYGLTGLWGGVADDVYATALMLNAPAAGHAGAVALWADADLLVDEIATLAPRLRARSKPVTVEGPAGAVLHAVQGTCCLEYRTPAGRARKSAGGVAHCSTCPLLDRQIV